MNRDRSRFSQNESAEMLMETERDTNDLEVALLSPDAYPGITAETVEMIETHISRIFLVGEYAFKVKKQIQTPYLDYSTLALRERACHAELRLDRRYSDELYLDVVPIVIHQGRIKVDADGDVIEYAVKMRRFDDNALLSNHVQENRIGSSETQELAITIADFHRLAGRLKSTQFGLPEQILKDAIDNLDAIEPTVTDGLAQTVHVLRSWTSQYHTDHLEDFNSRYRNGFIRQCHGDLHLGNIVHWQGKFTPFDGIEFSESFRCIDTLSDAAFVAMDFAAHGRLDLCRSFINAYLDAIGDHGTLCVLRWYLVYRSLVRAKVIALRIAQEPRDGTLKGKLQDYIDLAYRFSLAEEPTIWITHGVSGSGKTTISEKVVQLHGAIRIRSDVERKRYMGMSPTDRPTDKQAEKLYSSFTSHATYLRLQMLTKRILHAGFPVVVDATFLKRRDRDSFRQLAEDYGATFRILHCQADVETLRERIRNRLAKNDDASDADIAILETQLTHHEPIDQSELPFVVDASDTQDFFETPHSNEKADHDT